MTEFKVIHIFDTGVTQVIGDRVKKFDGNSLPAQLEFVDHIESFKPASLTAMQFAAIHVFSGDHITYLGKGSKGSFTISLDQVDQRILGEFIREAVEKAAA